jgi:hypothetical protein
MVFWVLPYQKKLIIAKIYIDISINPISVIPNNRNPTANPLR